MKENADRFDLKQRMVKIIIKTGIKPAAMLYAAGLKTIYQWVRGFTDMVFGK
jgi:hypothetical protein